MTTPENPLTATDPKKMSIDQMLNQRGFAEFLGEFDAKTGENSNKDIEAGDEESLRVRFESFSKSEGTKREIKNLFKNEIRNDIGVTLEDADYEAIDAYINKERIEGPEYVAHLAESLETFQRDKVIIAEKEGELKTIDSAYQAELAQLGGGDAIRAAHQLATEQAAIMNAYKNETGFFEQWGNAIKIGGEKNSGVISRIGNFLRLNVDKTIEAETERLNKEIEKYIKDVQPLHDLDRQKAELKRIKEGSEERFLALKGIIMKQVDKEGKIQAAAKKKITADITSLLNPAVGKKRTLEDAEKAQAILEKVKKTTSASSLEYVPEDEVDAMQKELDAAIQEDFSKEVEAVINGKDLKDQENALDKLKKSLAKFTTKQKLGSKEGKDAKDFIISTLELKKASVTDAAKKIFLTAIITSLRKTS